MKGQKLDSGKRFESWWCASAAQVEDTIVYRIPDKVYVDRRTNSLRSTQSEADFFWFGKNWTKIVECKASAGKSISFSALKEHQEESLLKFSEYMDAIVAVNLYNADNVKISNRLFHVPIKVWVEYKNELDRKSLPLQVLEDDDEIIEFKRIKGSIWNLKNL